MEKKVSYTDSMLLQLIGEGDETAFNEIFDRYRNRLYNYLVKVTKSKESAEEATLDVFLKIWNAKGMLHEIINFEAFLFRVARNKAMDYVRKAASNRLVQQEIWEDLEKLVSETTADQKILSAETELAINTAINKLPPQRQMAFRLSREEWLSYDEIAERMHISRNTVRNHIVAALQFIRGNLDKGTEIATIILLTSKIN